MACERHRLPTISPTHREPSTHVMITAHMVVRVPQSWEICKKKEVGWCHKTIHGAQTVKCACERGACHGCVQRRAEEEDHAQEADGPHGRGFEPPESTFDPIRQAQRVERGVAAHTARHRKPSAHAEDAGEIGQDLQQ